MWSIGPINENSWLDCPSCRRVRPLQTRFGQSDFLAEHQPLSKADAGSFSLRVAGPLRKRTSDAMILSNVCFPVGRAGAVDPNPTAGLLQSSPTASHRFSCFASPKRPFVHSHTRPEAVGRHRPLSGHASHRIHPRRAAEMLRRFDIAGWHLQDLAVKGDN